MGFLRSSCHSLELKEKGEVDQKKQQAEIEIIKNEQHSKEVQINDLKHKLEKRTDELQSLKDCLN